MYSSRKNCPPSDSDRILYLENSMQAAINLLKHMGADVSDIQQMPFEQWIVREYSKALHKDTPKGKYPIGTRVVYRTDLNSRGKVVGHKNIYNRYGDDFNYDIIWDAGTSVSRHQESYVIPEYLINI